MTKAEVIAYFGSHEKTAKALTDKGFPISRVAVTAWPDIVPEVRAWQIQHITGGALVYRRSEYYEDVPA